MKILLVDDEPDVRKSLSRFLVRLGYSVSCAANGVEALQQFHADTFHLVITDIRMPEMDGLELMRRIKKVECAPADVIAITGYGDMENAVKALKYGAYDYLQKPVNIRDLAVIIERSAQYRMAAAPDAGPKPGPRARQGPGGEHFGAVTEELREPYLRQVGLQEMAVYSDAMRLVLDVAQKYGLDRSIPVLIQGETGTGKELVARFIHHYGAGNMLRPFIAINCGAVPRELFESELFGHERGAYTGASSDQVGKIEMAHGGTLFLDEIGEMPQSSQVKLLRVLEDKKFFRVGGAREIASDVRFIAATNKDVLQEIEAKRFRVDLYYRINVGFIRIPPLRERKEEILPLALRFASASAAQRGRRFGSFLPSAEDYLVSLPWPGNVRQLKNAMERLALLGPWDRVEAADLTFIGDPLPSPDLNGGRPILGRDDFDLPPEGLDLEALNRSIIAKAYRKQHRNQTRTAQYLRMSRRILQNKLSKMDIPE